MNELMQLLPPLLTPISDALLVVDKSIMARQQLLQLLQRCQLRLAGLSLHLVTDAGELRQLLQKLSAAHSSNSEPIQLALITMSSDNSVNWARDIIANHVQVNLATVIPLFEQLTVAEYLVEKLSPFAPAIQLSLTGIEIEQLSHDIIDQAAAGFLPEEILVRDVVKRVIHAAGDTAFAKRILIRPGALTAGLTALRQKANVFCDVKMLVAALTRLPVTPVCWIDRPEIIIKAKESGQTRSACAIETGVTHWSGNILVIGNAPTAIWQMLEMVQNGIVPPCLTVAMPVGFVGAREAKQALWQSGLACVTNIGARGGSAVTAAVINSLCRHLED